MKKERKHISFFERTHTYLNNNSKERYTSGTSFIGQFHEAFNAQEVATKLITQNPRYIERFKDYGLDVAVAILLGEWKQSAVTGTLIHGLLEDYLKGEDILARNVPHPHKLRYLQLINAYKSLNLESDYSDWVFEPEYIVFNDEYKKAGQADLVLFNHELKLFSVKDYKTNKKGIDKTSYGDKRMFSPVEHLQDCKFIHYSLQLSLYAFFLEIETGYSCESLDLLWVDTNNPKNITIEKIPCEYLKKDIISMLSTIDS